MRRRPPGADPELIHPIWPEHSSASLKRSREALLGKGMCGTPCCHRDPTSDQGGKVKSGLQLKIKKQEEKT